MAELSEKAALAVLTLLINVKIGRVQMRSSSSEKGGIQALTLDEYAELAMEELGRQLGGQ